jgi:DNA ligase 4
LTKLILKDLKLGISHETLLKMYHPQCLEFFNATSDLKQVFLEVDYDKVMFKVFFPVKPMLAAKLNLNQLCEFVRYKDQGVIVETKFDGERIQCHYQNK